MKTENLSVYNRLQAVSFKLTPGCGHFLLGANGSGKTTLLKALAGIISYNGETELGRNNTFYLPQKISIYEPIIVKDFLELVGGSALGELGVEELLYRPMTELSAGECQRVFLCGITSKPETVLLLDEPTSFLDPLAKNRLMKFLEGRTFLMATHDLDLIKDRTCFALKSGSLLNNVCTESLYC